MKSSTSTYCKFFATEREAMSWARVKTIAHEKGNGQKFVVVDGPADNFAVMDLKSAIDMDLGYKF